jgi:hypothetical protein
MTIVERLRAWLHDVNQPRHFCDGCDDLVTCPHVLPVTVTVASVATGYCGDVSMSGRFCTACASRSGFRVLAQ